MPDVQLGKVVDNFFKVVDNSMRNGAKIVDNFCKIVDPVSERLRQNCG